MRQLQPIPKQDMVQKPRRSRMVSGTALEFCDWTSISCSATKPHTMHIQRLLLIFLLITPALFAVDPDRKHIVKQGDQLIEPEESKTYGDTFSWQELGPVDFLNYLKTQSSIYYINGRHFKWIHESDIPKLAMLLDSTEPCAPIVMTICSVRFPESTRSTIGDQAMCLIDGYKEGYYPASITSIFHSDTYRNKMTSEIRKWLMQFYLTHPDYKQIPSK